MKEEKVTYIGYTDYRNEKIRFGIKAKDRTRHVYIIGKTGMGKSTLLENMAVQDILDGNGFAFIDPHGSACETLLDYIPEDRMKDVLVFSPFDMEYPVSFNVMEDVGADKRHLVANGLMSAFKKLWVDAWSARMEYILNNVMLALLEYPDSTLIGVNRMLADKEYRKKVVENVTDPSVKSFWIDEFAKYGERYMQEAGAAIQNKIGQFISNPLVRNIIGQPKSTFDIREMMDSRKIILINLSKGKVGEANANLIGSMLITKIYLAAMSRADVSVSELQKLPNFYMYVDEFQSFANESFADILSEARKYKLNLTIAHQYVAQMSDEVRDAVIGNVGTMIVFRVGSYDAEVFEKEYSPEFTVEDFVNLGYTQVYLKLMIDGVTSPPFSATTLPPIEQPKISYKDLIIQSSRKKYAMPRNIVEEEIKRWHQSPADSREVKKPFRNDRGGSGDKRKNFTREKKKDRKEFQEKMENRNSFNSEKSKSSEKSKLENENDVDREAELREAISLTYLKKKDKQKKIIDTKTASKKNLNELKDALISIMNQSESNKEPSNNSQRNKTIRSGKQNEVGTEPQFDGQSEKSSSNLDQPQAEINTKPKEIPENTLRKVLEMD